MGNITATELHAIATSVKNNEMRKRKEILQQWFENEILPICKKIAEKGEFFARFQRDRIPTSEVYITELQQLIISYNFRFSYSEETFIIYW